MGRPARLKVLALGALLVAGAVGAAAGGTQSVPVELATAAQLRSRLDAAHGKVVVLNLWGTWCVSCLREIPDLVQLDRELGPRGLVLFGVAMDEPTALDSVVRPFHAKYFPAFPTFVRNESDMDTMASVVDPAWNELLPTTYLIARNGRVAQRIQGRRTPEELRALLEPLLEAR